VRMLDMRTSPVSTEFETFRPTFRRLLRVVRTAKCARAS
jgi:hypothetical protein